MPGGGVEPPRPEGRRILSPLRLPVPPSRLFVEVLDFTIYILPCSFAAHHDECETVQESVKVFGDLHRFLSFASVVLCSRFRAKVSLVPSPKKRHRYEIVPSVAPAASCLNYGVAVRHSTVLSAEKRILHSWTSPDGESSSGMDKPH